MSVVSQPAPAEIVVIKNLEGNLDYVEAVLDVVYASEAHIAPHGQTKARQDQAEADLKSRYGYSLSGRTMVEKVKTMIKGHSVSENRKDGETGQEHEVDEKQVIFRFCRSPSCS
jgi:hypothetical protein